MSAHTSAFDLPTERPLAATSTSRAAEQGTAQHGLIGEAPAFRQALRLIERYARSDATVLILGETGTGKELAARAVHYLSARRDRPFVPVNCGAIPEHLVESELFGNTRGAFTDAREARGGLVAEAQGGSLFLDEIEVLGSRAQAALLRFLQDKEYRPVGSSTPRRADVRIIGSSNVDLRVLAEKGAIRTDLLFRLNCMSVRLPALRHRDGDIALLAQAFLDRQNAQARQPAKSLHEETLAVLSAYPWPGNVRELLNLITREYVLCPDRTIRIPCIDPDYCVAPVSGDSPIALDRSFKAAKAQAVAHFERTYLTALLSRTDGNILQASRIAGKDRSDLSKLIRKYGLRKH